MMEIKFRVWDKSIPTYDEASENKEPSGMMLGMRYGLNSDYLQGGFEGKYPIMQYTGLKDKNGVEIYEGDIICTKKIFGFHSELMEEWQKLNDLETINGIGSLFEGVIVLDFQRGLMIKRLDNDYSEPLFTRNYNNRLLWDQTQIEIIGNIYSNPEKIN